MDRRITGWKVWYENGKKISGSSREEWEKLPDDGVLVVMLYQVERYDIGNGLSHPYRRIMQGSNFYFMCDGKEDYIYGQTDDNEELILKRYPDASIKIGKWSDDHHYGMIVDEAMEDMTEDW